MSNVDAYSAKGIKSGTFALPKDFSEKENLALLAQAIRVYSSRIHIGVAKVKTRAEVNATKRKIYKQKGTGGARHGYRSAPIFVGGGVAHGPKVVSRELTLPKKLAKKALNVAFSLKAKNKEIVVVSGMEGFKKTKEASELIEKIVKGREGKFKQFTFALSQENLGARRMLKNIEGVRVLLYKDLNAYNVYFGGFLVFDKAVFTAKTSIAPKKEEKPSKKVTKVKVAKKISKK